MKEFPHLSLEEEKKHSKPSDSQTEMTDRFNKYLYEKGDVASLN